MIPRTIVTAWFGRNEKADIFKRCEESWHKTMPDWNFVTVNEDNCPEIIDTPYMQGVLSRKEQVKATELGRLYGVWKHGGCYLDLDMEVIKPFDSLLDQSLFFVRQQDGLINGAMFGAYQGHDGIKWLIDNFPSQTTGELSPLDYGPRYLTAQHPEVLRRWSTTTFAHKLCFPWFWTEKDPGPPYPPETLALHRWAASWG